MNASDPTKQPTPGLGPAGTGDHLPERTARPLKAMGLAGYGLLLVAIGLLAGTLAAAALDARLAPWIIATVVCFAVAVGLLLFSRTRLVGHAGSDRPQHDPLIPEVSAEEAAAYEEVRRGPEHERPQR